MTLTVTARGMFANRTAGGTMGVTLPDEEATVRRLLEHLWLASSSCVVVLSGTAASQRMRDGDRSG